MRFSETESPPDISGMDCVQAAAKHTDEANRELKSAGMLPVILSGISAVVYFLASHGIRNYLVFIRDSFENVVRVLSR